MNTCYVIKQEKRNRYNCGSQGTGGHGQRSPPSFGCPAPQHPRRAQRPSPTSEPATRCSRFPAEGKFTTLKPVLTRTFSRGTGALRAARAAFMPSEPSTIRGASYFEPPTFLAAQLTPCAPSSAATAALTVRTPEPAPAPSGTPLLKSFLPSFPREPLASGPPLLSLQPPGSSPEATESRPPFPAHRNPTDTQGPGEEASPPAGPPHACRCRGAAPPTHPPLLPKRAPRLATCRQRGCPPGREHSPAQWP